MDKKTIGIMGEDYAAERLKSEGWEIVERNYRCRYGEIDIIAVKGDVLAFVEVKTRSAAPLYRPYEAVGYAKQQKLIRTAQSYLMQNETEFYPRFDVIEIELKTGNGFAVARYQHIENAFTL